MMKPRVVKIEPRVVCLLFMVLLGPSVYKSFIPMYITKNEPRYFKIVITG